MDSFYIIVLVVAIVLLILVLVFISLLMRNSTGAGAFPPVANTCPDYWDYDNSDPNRPVCKMPTNGINKGNLTSIPTGYGSGNNLDMSDTIWSSGGLTANCAKNKWANENNIQWDGVSNYNSCIPPSK
jgi:hypothetical protein